MIRARRVVQAVAAAVAACVPTGPVNCRAAPGITPPAGTYAFDVVVAPVWPVGDFTVRVIDDAGLSIQGTASLAIDPKGNVTGLLALVGLDDDVFDVTGKFVVGSKSTTLTLNGSGNTGRIRVSAVLDSLAFRGTAKGAVVGPRAAFVLDVADAAPLRLLGDLTIVQTSRKLGGTIDAELLGQPVTMAVSGAAGKKLSLKAVGGGLSIVGTATAGSAGGWLVAWSSSGFGAKKSPDAGTLARVTHATSSTVDASAGGALALDDSSGIVLPPGALGSTAELRFDRISAAPRMTPSAFIAGVGPALVLRRAAGVLKSASAASSSEPIRVELRWPSGTYDRLDGAGAFVETVDLRGRSTFVGLPVEVDMPSNRATISVPPPVLEGAREARFSLANVVSVGKRLEVPLGPVYWNGRRWIPGVPRKFDCRKKTAVLVHGILSSVEGAFNAASLATFGDYDQVVGFNYDWTQHVNDSGAQLAQFLADLRTAARCPQGREFAVDVHAHSLGAVVSLSAACGSDVHVRNMVLYGGPIMGTPAADNPHGLGNVVSMAQTVLMSLPARLSVRLETLATLQELLGLPFLEDIKPGSSVLAAINSCVAEKMAERGTCVTVVAGDKSGWIGALLGFGAEPNDGVVPRDSAQGIGSGLDGLGNCFHALPAYPLHHTELTRDPFVLSDVGRQVYVAELKPGDATYSTTFSGIGYHGGPSYCYWRHSISGTITITLWGPKHELDEPGYFKNCVVTCSDSISPITQIDCAGTSSPPRAVTGGVGSAYSTTDDGRNITMRVFLTDPPGQTAWSMEGAEVVGDVLHATLRAISSDMNGELLMPVQLQRR